MPVMDEFKKEREAMKDQPLSKRMDYFWEYYKWWVIGGVALILILFFTIRSIVTKKNEALYIAMVNTVATEESNAYENITVPFLTNNEINLKKNTINFDTRFVMSLDDELNSQQMMSTASNAASSNIYGGGSSNSVLDSEQQLAVYIAAGSVDMIYCSDDWTDEYAYNSVFAPVSTYMTEEEIAKYSDYLYYIDGAVLDRLEKARDEMDYDYTEEYPLSDEHEAMENPIPIGFCVENNETLNADFVCAEGDAKHIVMSVVINSENYDLAKNFIISILDNSLAVTE